MVGDEMGTINPRWYAVNALETTSTPRLTCNVAANHRSRDCKDSPYKRGVTGSIPVPPTRQNSLHP
jgi:hypothetical protein